MDWMGHHDERHGRRNTADGVVIAFAVTGGSRAQWGEELDHCVAYLQLIQHCVQTIHH